MHRFFVSPEQIGEKKIIIEGTDVNHIKNVLRMKEKEEILISDQDKMEYHCQIEALEDDRVVAKIMYAQEVGLELPCCIYLFQGLPKSDKMELIIQKAVELGACEIIPVASHRCVVKLDAKKEATKRKRWQAIAESAAKQAKRMYIPQVTNVMKFDQALQYAQQCDVKLIPYELAKDMEATRSILRGIKKGQSIGIFIGPEGGFEETEIEEAVRQNVRPITLGKRILRTETAGFTLLSVLMFALEE
ncbi:MAG: 16S rRNA (uracil(1498)-N(3))-methyltransferase [Lachnospiraceae bacterium]